MSRQITITLPDASTKVVDAGTTPGEVAAQIGSRLAKAAIAAKVDGDWWDLGRPVDHDASVEIVVAASPEGREVLRHSTAHVMAEAVTRPVPGREVHDRPGDRRRLLLRLRPPRRPHVHRRRPRQDRGTRCARSCSADQQFVRDEVTYDDALAVFAEQPYKQEIIEKVRTGVADTEDAGEVGGDSGVSLYRNVVDGAGRVRRPVPRPARAVHRAPRRVQAHEGRGRVLARQREGPDAPAHLRHRVGVAEGARRVPAPPRGGRDGATTASSAPSSTCSRSPRRSARGSRCSTRRAGSSAG